MHAAPQKTGPCERCGSNDWLEHTKEYVTKSGEVRRYRHRKCRECARRRKRRYDAGRRLEA